MNSNPTGAAGRGPLQRKSVPAEPAVVRTRGPAEVVEAQWRRLSTSWGWMRQRHEVDWPGMPYPRTVELLEAAGAEPALRQLFPFTSHWNLHFSSCTHFPYVVRVPFVEPLRDGRFRIRERGTGTVFDEADSAREAVALVLVHAPADLGPAVAGNASDFGEFEV